MLIRDQILPRMSVCIDNSKFLSKTVTKRIYVRDILIDIPKAGQATNEPLVPRALMIDLAMAMLSMERST